MVRTGMLIVWSGFSVGCEPFEETGEIRPVTAELAGRCARTSQDAGIYESGGDPVGKFYLDTRDINNPPVQVLPVGTEVIVRRVIYHTSFEHSEVVVIGDVGGRSNVIVSRLFTDDSLQQIRRSVRDGKWATRTAALRPSVAEWCR